MGEKCAKCNGLFDPVTDRDLVATCCDCKGRFHSGCCTTKTWNAWTKRNAKRSEWKCVSCKAESSSTHSRSDNEVAPSGYTSLLAAIQELRGDIASNHREYKERFDGLEQSLKTLRESVEDSKERIKVLEEANVSLGGLVQENKTMIDKNNAEMEKMRFDILELQQYSRRNNLEIKGIPTSQGENVYNILERISRVLDVPWRSGEISIAHRLRRPENGPPAIVVAFVCRTTKEEWLYAAKTKKLNTTDLYSKLPPGPVYINNHLIPHNKQLLGRARQLVRDRKLGNAWTVDGKVMVRRMSGGAGTRVFQMEDLDKVIE